MSEHEFRMEVWRHVVAIVKVLARFWFDRKVVISNDSS